jgi:hypothetical protein
VAPACSDQPDGGRDEIHLVLNHHELASIIMALRAIELHGFAERLDAVLREAAP